MNGARGVQAAEASRMAQVEASQATLSTTDLSTSYSGNFLCLCILVIALM